MKTFKTISLVLIAIFAVNAVACKGAKSASSTAKAVMSDNYRLVISFISKGTGTDGSAKDAIQKYIDGHPKKPALESYNWGREGEVDFCLKLTELSAKEQKTFVEEIRKLAGKSDLVQISENAPCVHKK